MMFKPDGFELYELLPEKEYNLWYPLYGDKLWRAFPYEYRWTLHHLRLKYGVMYMNDWYWRKDDPEANQFKGYRPMNCLTGASTSIHKFWRAGDPSFKNIIADAVRWDCLQNSDANCFRYITEIEENVPWFHFAVGTHNKAFEGITVLTE